MKIYCSGRLPLLLYVVVVGATFVASAMRLKGKSHHIESLGYTDARKATQRTIGSVIPWPKEIKFLNNNLDYLAIDPSSFTLNLSNEVKSCAIVRRAVERYTRKYLFDDVKPEDKDDSHMRKMKKIGSLSELNVITTSQPFAGSESKFKCESMPHADMDESYNLSIVISSSQSENSVPTAELNAQTSWGLLRGLETFSQLVFNIAPNLYAVQTVLVNDSPRFKHRGFMLDTARHYISMSKILDLLNAMAFNKLNVFHWHMVDDQSFPFESHVYPEVTMRTSFRPNMIYSQRDVKFVTEYAADRGIRVLPELDTPGHSYALRYVPDLLTKCYDRTTMKPNGNLGPIDPTKVGTYKKIVKLIDEFNTLFPDSYFHAGGDEVDFDCWKSNPDINKWMGERNMTGNYQELSNYYIRRVYDLLAHYNKTMLVWEEVFDDGANLPKDAIVHVWKYINDRPAYMAELKNVVKAGYKTLLSSCWYLNYIDYAQDWVKFYQCDPTSEPITKEEEHLVLGGEICMWTEYVDDMNVLTRSWPRASAAAERLWSPKTKVDVGEFLHRLEQIRCRMLYRGIQTEPVNGPGYC